jgi:hypothetical protein
MWNGMTRHVSTPGGRHASPQGVVKVLVHGPPKRAGVVSVFRREPLATDELFNFAITQFDRDAAHPLPSPLAMLAHAGGRRRARQPFCRWGRFCCPWIIFHQCTGSGGRIWFRSMSRKISKSQGGVKSHRITCTKNGRSASGPVGLPLRARWEYPVFARTQRLEST